MGRIGTGLPVRDYATRRRSATRPGERAFARAPRPSRGSARGRPRAASHRRRRPSARRAAASPTRPYRPGRRSAATSERVDGGRVVVEARRRARRPAARPARSRSPARAIPAGASPGPAAPRSASGRRRRRARPSPVRARRPALGSSSPARIRSSVVLPAQRGPSTPCTCPGASTRSTPSSVVRVPWTHASELTSMQDCITLIIWRGDGPAALDEGPGSARVGRMEEAALAALDLDALARDAADLVRIPSVTGDERGAAELVAARADAAGLEAGLHVHDLAALRAHPDHPGEEAARGELWGATATLPGSRARAARAQRARRRRRPGNRALGARSVLRRASPDGRLHGRGVGRHEGRRDRRAARARRDPPRRRRRARGRPAGRRRPRRTAASARSPRSSATTPSTPRCCPSRPACASSARRRAR